MKHSFTAFCEGLCLWVGLVAVFYVVGLQASRDASKERGDDGVVTMETKRVVYGFWVGGLLAQITQSQRVDSAAYAEPTVRRAYPRGLVPRAELHQESGLNQAPAGQEWRAWIDSRYIDTQTLYVAIYQVGMERLHFSSGWVDGAIGPMMEAAVASFQRSMGIPQTGRIDVLTSQAMGSIPQPFILYTITAEDVKLVDPPPEKFLDKSKKKRLGYYNLWEVLVEKFHVAPYFLRRLNPAVQELGVGVQVVVPNVESKRPLPSYKDVGEIKVHLTSKSIQVFDKKARIVAHFPIAIAADKEKAPVGRLKVISSVENPNYLFNPEIMKEIAEKEGITQKLVIPPGPNNPVGIHWIGLNRPGYGIHGTAVPSQIGQAVSHGCIRLANWNVKKFRQMVKIGSEIDVVW
ncbi:MAG: L,D-transpeptidase [Methylacidiphilales bacterium]|nr:L,D-transpeptidase [Candidatus Methylacidiphilales bacterium]